MSGDQAGSLIAIAAALVLVGSALMRRRMPRTTMIRYSAIWVAIFALAFLLVRWLGLR